jgi:hypothetical protein
VPKLTATFTHPLHTQFLVQLDNQDSIILETSEGNFNISASLQQDTSWGDKGKDDLHFVRGISEIIVRVTRDEKSLPPPPGITPAGGKDWTTQHDYFSERTPEYRGAALLVINRIIRFFKYTLHQPLLKEITAFEQSL